MLSRRGFTAGMLGASALAGLPVPSARAQAPTKFSLATEWAFQGLHAFLNLADARGEFARRGIAVDMQRGFGTLNTVQRVSTGEVDIGFGDLNVALNFSLRAEAARRVVIFAPVYDESEAAIVVRAAEVNTIADLRRKRLAAPPGVTARLLFPAFAQANGIQPSDVVWQDVVPNMREFMLVKRQVDGIAGSISTMLPLLRASGVPESDLRVFRYADHGIDLLGLGLFARADTVADRGPALAAFAAGVYAGIQGILTDPAAGIDALARHYPYIDRESEAYRWQIARDRTLVTIHTRQAGIGTLPVARVERRLAVLARAAEIANPPPASELFTDRFLPPLEARRVPA